MGFNTVCFQSLLSRYRDKRSVSLGAEASSVYIVSEFSASQGHAVRVCLWERESSEWFSTLPLRSNEGSELALSVEMGTPGPDLGFV